MLIRTPVIYFSIFSKLPKQWLFKLIFNQRDKKDSGNDRLRLYRCSGSVGMIFVFEIFCQDNNRNDYDNFILNIFYITVFTLIFVNILIMFKRTCFQSVAQISFNTKFYFVNLWKNKIRFCKTNINPTNVKIKDYRLIFLRSFNGDTILSSTILKYSLHWYFSKRLWMSY